MAVITVGAIAGTKIFIGAANTAPSPDQYTEITNVSSIGVYGGTNFNKIAVEAIGDGYTRQIKGTQLAPSCDIVLNRDDDDPGQVLLKAASNDRNSFFPFKVQENDGPPANSFPSVTYFRGRVYGYATAGGGVNDLKRINTSIEVEPDSIIFVLAS